MQIVVRTQLTLQEIGDLRLWVSVRPGMVNSVISCSLDVLGPHSAYPLRTEPNQNPEYRHDA
ncbi:Uncharacterised protein [Mycobacteroides abscessus subsp. massiliense]|nr:Uncharacterised protein [Mycobacteroides abscessus subsp. massiliense]SKI59463.1 Uncharacterised protein [Mycobacteroides abscessus subsp. massiliense]SKI72038.1 Uncharacterised protein [Mycobacteroides abscessus subsp. massiliense]SKI86181.1 Uncharacterised protein [Mycobacteroides abscessus subsp. massiliense]SKL17708.1 Uncharacterised protein [Mycobacteroides abscessus subsp. massiliense]